MRNQVVSVMFRIYNLMKRTGYDVSGPEDGDVYRVLGMQCLPQQLIPRVQDLRQCHCDEDHRAICSSAAQQEPSWRKLQCVPK